MMFRDALGTSGNVFRQQVRAVLAVNAEMRALYWDIGRRWGQRKTYQSSFTASTASRPAAARPATQAVTVPASTTAAHSASRRSTGTRKSMVQ